MKDGIGNTISKGTILYWKSKDMMVQVVDVVEPKVEGNTSPPYLAVAIQIPVTGTRVDTEPVLGDFLMVVNPASESLLDRLANARKQ